MAESPSDAGRNRCFNTLISATRGKFVSPVTPYRLNQRIIAQQGLFMCQGDTDLSFMENLGSMFADHMPDYVMKIEVPMLFRNAGLRDLHRMNINHATIYPGLDGLAQFVKTGMTLEWETFLDQI